MTPSSSNTSQSQIDFGRYKRADQTSQVVQTPVSVQPQETNFISVNTQPINIDEFQPNLPQTNKESDSETETEIWSFDRAIFLLSYVLRLNRIKPQLNLFLR